MRLLEEVRVATPLGIRFWDPVHDAQIRDGLHVTARPSGASGPVRRAFRTASDVYAFTGLPGVPGSASPPGIHTWLVEVEDARRRYLPVAFEVDLPLPYLGVFLSGVQQSPPGSAPPGLHLYPAPARRSAPGQAVVRGELADQDASAGAGHALVRIVVEQEHVYYGAAGEDGRFAVIFPYPPLPDELAGSPGGDGAATPLSERTWDVDVEVFYDPATRAPLAGTAIPEYRSILNQPAAQLWTTEPASPVEDSAQSTWSGLLTYRQELIVSTAGRSELLVSAPSGV